MLHIIFIILKILGCILLGILALLLLVLLLVLFMPVQYRCDGSFYGKPKALVRVKWLFGFLRVQAGIDGKDIDADVFVLWFKIFGRHKNEKKEKFEENIPEVRLDDYEEAFETIPDVKNASGDASETKVILKTEPSLCEDPKPQTEAVEHELKAASDEIPVQAPVRISKSKQKKKLFKHKVKKSAKKETGKKSLSDQLDDRISKLEKKLEKAKSKAEQLLSKKERVEKLYHQSFVKNSIELGKKAVISIFRHFKPRRVCGNVHFGMKKPSDTGKILGCISMLYGMYGDSLKVYPDFENPVFEGELHIKGHIQIAILVYWGLRAIISKDVRKLIKFIKHIKNKEETLWQ